MTGNKRSLETIAGEIHALQRKNVFAVGELLLEAQAVCEHGDWGDWLDENGFSSSSADRYMKVAALGTKFPKLGNLKLAKGTFYTLAGEQEDLLPCSSTRWPRAPPRRS
jgi:hypothetical protein